MMLVQTLNIDGETWIKHSSDMYTIIQNETGVEYASAIDLYPTKFTYKETTNMKPILTWPSLLECERVLEIRD